jgi:phosphohistidine swiveling domain-containing protein/nucleoside-diphosphate-sugar epimerase
MDVVISGDDALCIGAELTRRGHRVHRMPSDQENTAETLARVMTQTGVPADAVVHLAQPSPGESAVPEVGAVLDAMRRAGVRRLVVMSSAMADRPSADGLEHRVTTSGVDTLLVRMAPVMGRDSVGVTQRRFAAPVILGGKNGGNTTQFVHPDDVARFVGDAVENPEWTGTVNLAASDSLTLRQVAAILDKRYFQLRRTIANCAIVDTTRLGELGFVPSWSSRDCVMDFRKANREHIYLGSKRIRLPLRFPWVKAPEPRRDGSHRRPATDDNGEFDTDVDPDWAVYTAVNTSEAFPGPMTPLSLELSLKGMRAMGALAVDLLRLDGALRRAVVQDQTGSFGHRIYANLSVLFATGSVLPGANPAGWGDKLFGAGSGAAVPEVDKIGWLGMARRLPRMLTFVVAAAGETRRMEGEARAHQCGPGFYAGLPVEQLRSQLRCTHDEVVSAWAVAATITLAVVPILGILEKLAGRSLGTECAGGTEKLASAGLTLASHQLAAHAHADAAIAAVLRDHSPEDALRRLREQHPKFVAQFDDVITEWGHRGPGETELINPVFADNPARLLDVVAKLADTAGRGFRPARSLSPWVRLLAWEGAWLQRWRERARDAAIRLTHEYRLIAREIGARLVSLGTIGDRDDVFYLIRDELLYPPLDVRYLVLRRKVERARLQREPPPMEFVGRWEPLKDADRELHCGESLSGIPASVGVAKGRVRVVTADSVNDLQPGEILVATSIDVGWTPFFTYAAAVVVDTGATMAHAAIVARQFGIPCVVGSKIGSRALHTGHVVEVDGTSGRVTRIA